MDEHNTMLAFWIVFLLPFAVQGNCGSRPPSQARIVGGTEASVNSWPWQAMLLKYPDRTQFCGGTLIDPSWVITAAHCVAVGQSPSSLFVRMGAHFRVDGTVGTEQDIDVTQIFVHENFNSPLYFSNDIALLRLAKPVNLSDEVGPACLPVSNQSLLDKTCWITGWGTLSAGGSQPNTLMQASVPLVSKQTCLQAYPDEQLDDTMLCAGYAQGGVDACQGDSGGPLVCEFSGKWYLVGITSWGQGCAAPNKYGVYAKVPVFMSWTNAKMNSSGSPVAANTTSATHSTGTTSGSQSVSQYVSISASTNHLPAVTYSAEHSVSASTMAYQSISTSTRHLSAVIPSVQQSILASTMVYQSISPSTSHLSAATPSVKHSVLASTMEFPVVSKSENRGVSISGSESSSVSPSEGRSISASLFPNAMLILNTFLIEKLLRILFF